LRYGERTHLHPLRPRSNLGVVRERHALDVEPLRLALGPVLVPERRLQVLRRGRRRDGESAVRVLQERVQKRAADAVAAVGEDDELAAVVRRVGGGGRERGGGGGGG
jgi:hypothetical protein